MNAEKKTDVDAIAAPRIMAGLGDYLPVLRSRASRLRRALNDAQTRTGQFAVAMAWAACTFSLATVAAYFFR